MGSKRLEGISVEEAMVTRTQLLEEELSSLKEELALCQADKEFVWSLWKRLQVTNPDLTQAVSLVVEREKQKSEAKDRKVLEILQVKDAKIQELEQVQERFLADGNDRLKLVVLLCGEDDEKVQNAAAGALAMLTAAHKKLCLKMTQVTTQWLEILQRLCLHDRLSVQHRGLVIAYNLLAADAELAKKLVESELLEILTVVGKQEPDEKRAEVVQTARECLIKCMDYGFIKPVS